MTRTIIACVCSSLLTVGLLGVIGAGPLDPPDGPIVPTGVSLDQLAATMASTSPGAVVPGRLLSGGGGTATIVFTDRTAVVPLVGYGITKAFNSVATISIAFESGLSGGHLDSGVAASLTIVGSDGTTIGPVSVTRKSRDMVNGPVVGGNKGVSVVYYVTGGSAVPVPIIDQAGTGVF